MRKQFKKLLQTVKDVLLAVRVVKKARAFQAPRAEITSNCYLAPMLLADGTVGLVATVIDDEVWVDGEEVEWEGAELILRTPDYERLIEDIAKAVL